MFKSVDYSEVEGSPDLKAKAQQLLPVLANEIRTWRDNVEVRWTPHTGPDGVLDLTLSLTLENGVSETRTGVIRLKDFDRESWLASRCGRVWSDVLGGLINQLDARVQESLLEPTEA
jgi:hypothetical protein